MRLVKQECCQYHVQPSQWINLNVLAFFEENTYCAIDRTNDRDYPFKVYLFLDAVRMKGVILIVTLNDKCHSLITFHYTHYSIGYRLMDSNLMIQSYN